MSYIMKLRETVGNVPLLLPAASVIAVKENKILLQKRADNGLWSYPGGYMELGETPEQSAKREFNEETGNIAINLTLFGVFAGEERHKTYPNGHEVYITDIVYVCDEIEETDQNHDDEVLEVKWFHVDNLPVKNLCPTVSGIIEKFLLELKSGRRIKK